MGGKGSKGLCSCGDQRFVRVDLTAEEKETAERLASLGFSVEQLLLFYREHAEKGLLTKGVTTDAVVRDVVLPQTEKLQCSYMESDFMRARGGPQLATTFVSHSWGSPFSNTVLNILLDATGSKDLLKSRCLDIDVEPAELDCDKALRELGDQALKRTYWLCIFAVNQHRSICGDCSSCRLKPNAEAWDGVMFAADPCASCGRPKRHPCRCGARKTRAGEASYEIDKVEEVATTWMERVMVSLDPELATLSRIWVLRELWMALHGMPVVLRMAEAMEDKPKKKLQQGSSITTPVQECGATYAIDRERILAEIESDEEGGVQAFDELIGLLVELNFGRMRRLATASPAVARAVRNIEHLDMKFQWCSNALSDLEKLGFGQQLLGRLDRLHSLAVDLSRCKRLGSLSKLASEWSALPRLQALVLDLSFCESIEDFSELEALGNLRELRDLRLHLSEAPIKRLTSLGSGVGKLKKLQTLIMDFAYCENIEDLNGLEVLGSLTELTECRLNFSGTGIRDLASLSGTGSILKMQTLDMNFGSCVSLEDVSGLQSLAGLRELDECKLNLYCTNITDLSALEAALEGLKERGVLDINFTVARRSRMLAGWTEWVASPRSVCTKSEWQPSPRSQVG